VRRLIRAALTLIKTQTLGLRGWWQWILTFQRLRTVRQICWTFLKRSLERSIFDLAIPFDSLVPIPPTIWLTAVKDKSLSFFQRNKDLRAYIGNFWGLVGIRKIFWILVNGSCFFDFYLRGQQSGWMCRKTMFFRRFDKRLFLWKCQKRHFRNVTNPRGGEHRIGRTFLNFCLTGCKSTKKCAKSTSLNMKVRIRKC
jgi:hypothetical protein